MLSLRCRCGHSPFAQLLARRLSGPCAGIDVAHGPEPFLSFRQRREVTHVKAKPLAAFLESTADEEAEAFEFRLLRSRKRHGRRGRTQIENEGACARRLRRDLFPGTHARRGARCQIWRWCHKLFPGPIRNSATRSAGRTSRREGVRAFAPGARSWQPRRHRNPSFRPVALRPRLSTGLPLSLQVSSVKASRLTVKRLYCVQPLSGSAHIWIARNMSQRSDEIRNSVSLLDRTQRELEGGNCQPASRTSPAFAPACARACNNSVTTWHDRGRAR